MKRSRLPGSMACTLRATVGARRSGQGHRSGRSAAPLAARRYPAPVSILEEAPVLDPRRCAPDRRRPVGTARPSRPRPRQPPGPQLPDHHRRTRASCSRSPTPPSPTSPSMPRTPRCWPWSHLPIRVPRPVASLRGALREVVDLSGIPHSVRLLTYVDGRADDRTPATSRPSPHGSSARWLVGSAPPWPGSRTPGPTCPANGTCDAPRRWSPTSCPPSTAAWASESATSRPRPDGPWTRSPRTCPRRSSTPTSPTSTWSPIPVRTPGWSPRGSSTSAT